MDILLVDGYNIIGAWPELRKLKKTNLSAARDRLIEKMAEYQGYTGYKVIIVFDAYDVKGIQKKYRHHNVEVLYTKENDLQMKELRKWR